MAKAAEALDSGGNGAPNTAEVWLRLAAAV